MAFRDDDDAKRLRIEALERDLEATRLERDRAIEERDRAIEERDRPGGPFRKGDRVQVEWRGSWWPARVVDLVGDREWRIHYEGWGAQWDENVGPSRILPRSARPPGPVRAPRRPVASVAIFAALALLTALGIGAWLSYSTAPEGDITSIDVP